MKYSLFLFLTDMHFNALILIKSIIIFSVLKKCDHLEFFPVFAISPKELPVPPPCIILLALFQNFPSFWPHFRTSINLLPLPLSPFPSLPPHPIPSQYSFTFFPPASLSLSLSLCVTSPTGQFSSSITFTTLSPPQEYAVVFTRLYSVSVG